MKNIDAKSNMTNKQFEELEELAREKEIAEDVFNPNESDLEYFLRRKRELEQKRN